MEHTTQHGSHGVHGSGQGHYFRFSFMLLLSFIAMFVLMYAMVNTFGNALPNLNQAYMAGLMVAPMAIIELALMGAMYKNKKLNAILMIVSLVALVGFWFAIRQQVAIGDQQFLRSMIPHHAGAILMCEQTELKDPRNQKLCQDIISSQRAEIALMQSMLAEANKKH